jgi:hypothetical protein
MPCRAPNRIHKTNACRADTDDSGSAGVSQGAVVMRVCGAATVTNGKKETLIRVFDA